jgi:hypothetical protein
MRKSLSRTQRRVGVLLNYAALAMIPVIFAIGEAVDWSPITIGGMIACALLVVATLVRYHVGTGLWKLVHTKVADLDERQVQVTHGALRHSYSIFTILCLVGLLWKSIFHARGPDLIIIFAGLLYLAHTLPSSILAWTESEV